ncbi:DNA-binding protein [Motiliproteus sp. SC1-56]|uniref:DNA-binding protein n=1 Tax=Motiliproteus sp. SC1-56 TaxID=2799565 RepID=UPI001A8F2DC6|nr:DNA-binding protein [Motiliproteus sp. SC1-56]
MVSSTQELVFRAADELLQEGRRPTQQSVRERIGQGSVTTINKALNRWWAELGGRLQGRRRMPELPEPVEAAIKDIWQLALAHAEHQAEEARREAALRIKAEREQWTQERDEKQQVLSGYQEKLERAFDRIDALQRQLDERREQEGEEDRRLLDQERKLLAGERELRALNAENRKLRQTIERLEVELLNKLKNNSLSGKSENLDEAGAQEGLAEENRNLRTVLSQADTRLAHQEAELERLRKALQGED